jgi:alpha-tubulin suppressor-like RCC1 family protein
MGDNLPVVDLGTGRTATAISAGDEHTCAILDNASVKCWGDAYLGRLGYGNSNVQSVNDRGDNSSEMGDNLPVVDLGTGRTATAISAGTYHTCAILDNASVKCWGGLLLGAAFGNVDLGTGRTATAIIAGVNHTCAILDDASVKCWGDNRYGQLGYGNTDTIGDASDEMGDNLAAVDLGTGRTATAIIAYFLQTCALLDNSAVKCWGYNSNGQLGKGHTNNLGDDPYEMGDNLTAVDL